MTWQLSETVRNYE